jgi:starvation-inducible outer membrane lipoprotein
MKLAALCLAVAVLGGCATAPVVVRGDNYCRLAKRISWSKADTKQTTQEVRVHNAKYRRVCG